MSNDKHTPTATDFFIYKIGEPPVTASEKLAVVLMTEYAESLRADKAELIEALKQIEQFSDIGDGVLSGAIAVVRMKSIASQTLAKYETK